jgi:uncharacterized membrane protein YfcA
MGYDEAAAASLVVIAFSALSNTLPSMRSEVPVNWRAAAPFSVAVAPSSLIGVAASGFFPETLTQLVFAGFLPALAYPAALGQALSGRHRGLLVPQRAVALLGGSARGPRRAC